MCSECDQILLCRESDVEKTTESTSASVETDSQPSAEEGPSCAGRPESGKPSPKRVFPIPSVCPPPPALFSQLRKAGTEKEALTNMLMSWYMSGYHTGYFEGFKDGQKTANHG